jgi:hypothetical protein
MFDQKDQKDRDESELVRLTTEKKLRYRFDDMRSRASGCSGEPDLDHVLCGGQRGNEAVHVPKSLRTLASRARAGIGRSNVT